MARDQKLVDRFGVSTDGNYAVVNTLGTPHSYCIGAKHVAHAADHFSGILDEAAIESAERHGIYCATCRGNLKWKDHKVALLVECKDDLTLPGSNETKPELHEYLLACKAKLTSDEEYAGFAFVQARS